MITENQARESAAAFAEFCRQGVLENDRLNADASGIYRWTYSNHPFDVYCEVYEEGERRDIDYMSLPGIKKEIRKFDLWMSETGHWEAEDADIASAAAALGKRGGKARSAAKSAASRKNGKKGGRPKVREIEKLAE